MTHSHWINWRKSPIKGLFTEAEGRVEETPATRQYHESTHSLTAPRLPGAGGR